MIPRYEYTIKLIRMDMQPEEFGQTRQRMKRSVKEAKQMARTWVHEMKKARADAVIYIVRSRTKDGESRIIFSRTTVHTEAVDK